MKNTFTLPFIILVAVLSFAACKGSKSANSADSAKMDSVSTKDTTTHSDTSLKVDTVKTSTDTSDMKTDTVSKAIHKKIEIKKTMVKKSKQQ